MIRLATPGALAGESIDKLFGAVKITRASLAFHLQVIAGVRRRVIFAIAGKYAVAVSNGTEQEVDFFIHRRSECDAWYQEHECEQSADRYFREVHPGYSTICAAEISTGQLDPLVYGPIPVLASTD